MHYYANIQWDNTNVANASNIGLTVVIICSDYSKCIEKTDVTCWNIYSQFYSYSQMIRDKNIATVMNKQQISLSQSENIWPALDLIWAIKTAVLT